MSAQFTAFLDANVLYPAPLRDLLLELAVSDLYQARWSNLVLDEMKSNLLKNRMDLDPERIDRTICLMNSHIRDCLVEIPNEFVEAISDIPDLNDRHVVAGAVLSRCHAIVTWNLKDFPDETLGKYRLEAIDPDTFLENQFHLEPGKFLESVATVRQRLIKSPKTAAQYRSTLIKQGLVKTAAILKDFEILI